MKWSEGKGEVSHLLRRGGLVVHRQGHGGRGRVRLRHLGSGQAWRDVRRVLGGHGAWPWHGRCALDGADAEMLLRMCESAALPAACFPPTPRRLPARTPPKIRPACCGMGRDATRHDGMGDVRSCWPDADAAPRIPPVGLPFLLLFCLPSVPPLSRDARRPCCHPPAQDPPQDPPPDSPSQD